MRLFLKLTVIGCCSLSSQVGVCYERTERFDADPQWDARNNWSTAFEPRTIVQKFGYSRSHHAETTRLVLQPDDVDSSTVFDRFGIVTTWIDGNGQNNYFDFTHTYRQSEHDARAVEDR